MSEEFNVKVKSNLGAALIRLKHHFNIVSTTKVVFSAMRGLLTTWMQFTPPEKRIMGVKAIRADFKKVFTDTNWFAKNFISRKTPEEQVRIRRYFREKNFDALQHIKNDGGLFQRLTFKPFSKSDIHRNARGRMINNRQNIVVTNPEARNAYLKEKEDKVGRLKGSMAAALTYFGGRLPNWIKKNSEGDFKDYSTATDIKGARATSFVPYGLQVDQRESTIRRVYEAETHKIEGQMKHELNKSLKAFYEV